MANPFRSAQALMVQYAHYHRDRRNIATHLIGIPLIVLALGVWLDVPLPGTGLTLAWGFWVVSSVWYLSRGAGALGLATVALNAVLMALGQALAARVEGVWPVWQAGLLIFVLGWALQFLGHYWEGRKPAFADDLVGLLVGPMFIMGEVMMALGACQGLRQTIEAEAGPLR